MGKQNAHGTCCAHPSGQESSLSRTHESSPATLVEYCAFNEWTPACKTHNSHWVNSLNKDRPWRGHFLQTLDDLPGITLTTPECKTPVHTTSGKACLSFGCRAPSGPADYSSNPQWMLRHLHVPTRYYSGLISDSKKPPGAPAAEPHNESNNRIPLCDISLL